MSIGPFERRLWLIDGGYLFTAQNTVEPGFQFDYRKLREAVESHGSIWRAYYLNSVPSLASESQSGFHNWLRAAPPVGPKIVTKLYDLKPIRADSAYCSTCGELMHLRCPNNPGGEMHRLTREQQKGVDVGLATLALTLATEYHTLMLSSGDGDLIDAIEYLVHHGKRLELLVFRTGVSTELQARADAIYWIDDIRDEVRR